MLHPLDGPWARFQAAQERFLQLRQELEEYQSKTRYNFVIAERDADSEYFVLRVSASEPLPVSWGVLIGDIAHNLRASLDGLVWQLVQQNGLDPTLFRRPHLEFPIFADLDDYMRSGVPKIHERVSEKHESVIERAQPYHWGGKESSVLWKLHELNNADKHRSIQLAASRAGTTEERVVVRGFTYANRPPPGPTFSEVNRLTEFEQGSYLVDGQRVGRLHASVIERWPDITYLPLVTEIYFWEGSDALKGMPVIRTIDLMGKHVFNIVFGRFRDVFDPTLTTGV